MIAAWMLFSIIVGTWCAVVGTLLDPLLLMARRPTRWLWAGAILCAVCVPTGLAVHATSTRTVIGAENAAGIAHDGQVPAAARRSRATPRSFAFNPPMGAPRDSHASPRLLTTSSRTVDAERRPLAATRSWNVWDAEFVRAALGHAARFDRALLTGWLAMSLLLALAILAVARTTRLAATQSRTPAAIAGRARWTAPRRGEIDIVYAELRGPAAVGVFRPRIVLPRWVHVLDPAVRDLILRHESEHHEARDPALLVVAATLIVLLPWYAPLWWMASRLRMAIELDCDARVLRHAPDVRRYAELLLLVGSRATPAAQPRLARLTRSLHGLPFASPRAALARRILVMTTPRGPQRRGASVVPVLGALVCVALLALLPTPPAPRANRSMGAQRTVSPPPAVAESAFFDSRAVFADPLKVPGSGWHPTLTSAHWYPRLFDARAPRGTLHVRSVGGRRDTVLLYREPDSGHRASPVDTMRLPTPFEISRSPVAPPLHLRSASGAPIVVSAEIATAPALRETVTSAHVVLDPRAPRDTSRGFTWVNPGHSAVCGVLSPWSLQQLRTCP
jgi:beta-lactamase regulating signal transducer with metallopeptidase domain